MSSIYSIPSASVDGRIDNVHAGASLDNMDLELGGSFGSGNSYASNSTTAGNNGDGNIGMTEDAPQVGTQEEGNDVSPPHQNPRSSSAVGANVAVANANASDDSAEASPIASMPGLELTGITLTSSNSLSIRPEIVGDDSTAPPLPTGMLEAMSDPPPMASASPSEASMLSAQPMGFEEIGNNTGPSPPVTMTDVAAVDNGAQTKLLSGIELTDNDRDHSPPVPMTDVAKPEKDTAINPGVSGTAKSAKLEQINDGSGLPALSPDAASRAASGSLLKKTITPTAAAASSTGRVTGLDTPTELLAPNPLPEAAEGEDSPPNLISADESTDEVVEEQGSQPRDHLDPEIIVPEAYLVCEEDARRSRSDDANVPPPVYAEPVPIWYRQKRIQIAISFFCIVVVVLVMALGITMTSPTEPMTMVIIEDFPTPMPSMSSSPSKSLSPSFHPTLAPSNVPSQAPTTCMKQREIVLPDADSGINNKFAATNFIDTVAIVITEYSTQGNGDTFVSWGGIQLIVSKDISSWTYESAEQSRIRLLPSEKRIKEFVARVAMTVDTLLVGYHWKDEDGLYTNGALVFRKSVDYTWREEARLEPRDGHDYEGEFGSKHFGTSVAIEGNTAIVGAPLDLHDDGAGAAYVFVRAMDSTWTEQAKLLPDVGSILGRFGTAIALIGNTALISCHVEGLVYVFARTGIIWTPQSKLMPNDVIYSEDYFGLELALWSNIALIGAPKKDKQRGAAYVFVRQGDDTWIEETKLLPDSLSVGDQFGRALGLVDNIAFIGAPGHENTGAAFVFRRDSSKGTWKEEKTKLLPPDGPSAHDSGEMLERIAVEQFGNIVVPAFLTNVVVGANAGYRQDGVDCRFNICVSTSFSLSYVFNICMDVKEDDEVQTLAASSSTTLAPTTSPGPTPSPSISSPPTDTCHRVEIEVGLDNFPSETSWELKRIRDESVLLSYQAVSDDALLTDSICLQDGDYEFTIYDSYGDGICCMNGEGYYTLTSSDNGAVMVQGGENFGSKETSLFVIGFSSLAPATDYDGTSFPSHPTTVQTSSPSETPTGASSSSILPSTTPTEARALLLLYFPDWVSGYCINDPAKSSGSIGVTFHESAEECCEKWFLWEQAGCILSSP